MSTEGWAGRYRQGDRDRVWQELRQLGDRVREPGLREEATAVCDAMARRARHNVDVLVARLTAAGVRFHTNDRERRTTVPVVPATPASAAYAAWLDRTVGPVPLTVLSWIRIVGDVWLVGKHPQRPGLAAADPLVVELAGTRYPGTSMGDHVLGELDAWRDEAEHGEDSGLFVLPVAPDRLTKGDMSGGPPYGVVLPDGCADGMFVSATTTPFVAYLNDVFASGGYPWTPDTDPGWGPWRRALARDLLPL